MHRLFWLLLFVVSAYSMLGMRSLHARSLRATSAIWALVLITVTACSAVVHLRREKKLYSDYPYRIVERSDALLEASPASANGAVASITLLSEGYRLLSNQRLVVPRTSSNADQLSLAANGNSLLAEEASSKSTIVSYDPRFQVSLSNAQSPLNAANGGKLIYIRENHGHGQLFVHSAKPLSDTALSPASLNIEEATYLSDDVIIAAALDGGSRSQLYALHGNVAQPLIGTAEARYPTASPNGKWLAYSRFTNGVWNLWRMNLKSGASTRVADVPCNQIEAAWEPNSKYVLYSSDCGRALWFTAICRRKIVD